MTRLSWTYPWSFWPETRNKNNKKYDRINMNTPMIILTRIKKQKTKDDPIIVNIFFDHILLNAFNHWCHHYRHLSLHFCFFLDFPSSSSLTFSQIFSGTLSSSVISGVGCLLLLLTWHFGQISILFRSSFLLWSASLFPVAFCVVV